MIFAVRMIMEVANHNKMPIYWLFVDLVKAYDSVSREGLWAVLKAKGVPAGLLALIKDYYSGKTAAVSVEGGVSDVFGLDSGLGQGCCLAPLLFNLFFGAVIETWQYVSGGRLAWKTRLDGVLRRQQLDRYARAEKLDFQELGYADDLAAVTDTLQRLRKMFLDMNSHMCSWGLEISREKTKAMAAFQHLTGLLEEVPSTEPPIKFTQEFEYLGSQIQATGECVVDIRHRIDQARKAFWRLASVVWNVTQLSLKTKLMVYRSCVMSVLLYGSETWTVDWPRKAQLEKFHMTCLRKICGVSRMDQQTRGITNDQIKQCLGVPSIMQMVHQNRLRWVGHVARMDNDRLPKRMLFAFLPEGQGQHRLPGKAAGKRFRDGVVESLRVAGLPVTGWLQHACEGEGRAWKIATRGVALWFKPVHPHQRGVVPDRTQERIQVLGAPIRSPKKGVEKQWARAQEEVQACDSVFLQRENCNEDIPLYAAIAESAKHCLGAEWFRRQQQDILEELMGVEPWSNEINTAADLTLFAMAVQTEAQRQSMGSGLLELSPGPRPPRRTRILGKQNRPPGYFGVVGRDVREEDVEEDPGREGRPEQYWVRGPRVDADSEQLPFACTFAGCNRRFSTKFGLSHHVLRVHRQGTYRDRVWGCRFCPRVFDDERGLAKHLPLHEPGASPCVCCECGAFFPGRSSARMHVNHSHAARQLTFPLTCPHCIDGGRDPAPVFATAHAYSLHRLRKHVYDRWP